MRDRSNIIKELVNLEVQYEEGVEALKCAKSCGRVPLKSFECAQKFLKDHTLDDYQIAYADFIRNGSMPGLRHIKAAQYLDYQFDDQRVLRCKKRLGTLQAQIEDLRDEMKQVAKIRPSQVAGTVFELPVVGYHPLAEEAAIAKTVSVKH